jgi:G:T-mismatch repair DNA endonuclease (very short patch repair protein)
MMKTVYKISTALVAVSFVFSPFFVFAQNAAPRQQATGAAFCSRLENLSSETLSKMAERETKIEAARSQRQSNLGSRRQERDINLDGLRDKWEQNREEHYAKIEARLTTEDQKQALAVFKSAIEDAVTSRQTSVDRAISAFRSGIDAKISARKTAIDKAVSDFKTAVSAAYEKAEADCSGGADSRSVRQTLVASLKAAKEKYASDRREAEKIITSAEELTKVKNEAIRKAVADFKIAVEKARADLKMSLGTNSASPAPAQ